MPMQEMPVVTDEHRRLHVFAGDWIGEETLEPSPWGAGGPALGKYTGRVVCDGFFVAQDYAQEVNGAIGFRGHAVFGYDVPQKQFAWYWVDSMGSVPAQPAWGTWEGDTLQFTSHSPMGAGRYTYVFEGSDRYRFRLENSFDGGKTWHTFMTGVYRRA
jgi:hypothetical protein